jgi:DNA-binding transcriptional ArsR family regulator
MIQEAYDYFFETLANRRRLAIMDVLRKGQKNVSQIIEKTGFEQSNVSHNLRRLEDCGFVQAKKNGKERIYSLNKETIRPLIKLIDKHTEKFCSKCIRRKKP